MQKYLYLIGIGVLAMIASCQKVIDVDLNDADPKIVIEANFIATDSIVNVRVTYTANYFGANSPTTVDDAIVTITDGNGISTTIPSSGNAMYTLNNYIPTTGMTYSISVTHNGQTYTSSSLLSPQLDMQVPRSEYYEVGFFGEDGGYLVFFKFQDPAGLGNYYNVVLRANDTLFNKVSDFILGNDDLTDGNLIERPIFQDYYQVGDTVSFELQAINEQVYNYYSELQTIAGGQSSAAPANPTYYWSNKGLGYFSAYYYTKNGMKIVE